MFGMNVAESAERSGPDNRTLEECIRRCAAGEREGLATLYELTHAGVYGFALSILKNVDDAQDVVQDTFLQVLRYAPQYSPRQKPMAWVLTITKNLAYSRLRQRRRTEPMPENGWEPSVDGPEVTAEDRLALNALLEVLGDEEREIVTLHAVSGLKFREIGALLDLALSTVLSKYHRAMKKLHTAWKEAQ